MTVSIHQASGPTREQSNGKMRAALYQCLCACARIHPWPWCGRSATTSSGRNTVSAPPGMCRGLGQALVPAPFRTTLMRAAPTFMSHSQVGSMLNVTWTPAFIGSSEDHTMKTKAHDGLWYLVNGRACLLMMTSLLDAHHRTLPVGRFDPLPGEHSGHMAASGTSTATTKYSKSLHK